MSDYHDINRPGYVNTDRTLRNPPARGATSGIWAALAIIALLAIAIFAFAGGGPATRDDATVTPAPQAVPETAPVEEPATPQPAPVQPSNGG